MFKPSAQIIADSVNTSSDRLTTFVIKFHRFILPEFNTHRANSRSFQSSRACPVSKMISSVLADEVYPLHWGKNQKGMVAFEEIDGIGQLEASDIWDMARNDMIKHVKALLKIDVHKQVANRLLEPFMAVTGIVTATEYQNFFNQRCHPNAQPEIKALADAMKTEYENNKPVQLECGDWHVPFSALRYIKAKSEKCTDPEMLEEAIKIAVGRCARVSYDNHYGVRCHDDDIALHDRLLSENPAHLSPFEHVAIALPSSDRRANFTGFESYRYQLENKNNET